MKHIVRFTQGKRPDRFAGRRTFYAARCSTCLWFQEGGNLARLETAAKTTSTKDAPMSQPTLAALRAAHMTIYEATIEFEWESHPHLTEAEAEQVPHIIDTLLAEHKTRANLFTPTRTPLIYEEQ